MKTKYSAALILCLAFAGLCVLFLTGCTNLPFARTYSLNYSDGKQTVGGSVRFEPAPIDYRTLKHDGKTIVPPEEVGPRQTYSKTHGVNFGVPPGWAGRMDEWEAAGRPPFASEDIPKDWNTR